jgi:hypothetical protein
MGRKKKPPVRGRRAFLKVAGATAATYIVVMNNATALVERLLGGLSALRQRTARPALVVPVGQVVERDVALPVSFRVGDTLQLSERLLIQVVRNGQVIETREG